MKSPAAEEPSRTRTTSFTNIPDNANPALSPRRDTRVRPSAYTPTTPTGAKVRLGARIVRPRPGSKTAKVLALLKRRQGASLKDLLKATGWQPHSVRGFLSGTVSGKMGLRVSSSKTESGERHYVIKA